MTPKSLKQSIYFVFSLLLIMTFSVLSISATPTGKIGCPIVDNKVGDFIEIAPFDLPEGTMIQIAKLLWDEKKDCYKQGAALVHNHQSGRTYLFVSAGERGPYANLVINNIAIDGCTVKVQAKILNTSDDPANFTSNPMRAFYKEDADYALKEVKLTFIPNVTGTLF